MIVSVIIPYFNDCLDGVLDAIEAEFYSRSNDLHCTLEVICVSNGGKTYSPVKSYSFKFSSINENQYLSSPYSARNRGVEAADSDWYIFLDSTCIPEKGWFDVLKSFRKDQVYAANVKFYSIDETTLGDIYDSIVNIDNQKTVKQSGVAKTACLAVSSFTMQSVGLFEEGIRSGGDVIWTSKANSLGFKVVFSQDWIVRKESRNTKELVKKQFRVSSGWFKVWQENGTVFPNFVKRVVLFFVPPNPLQLFNTAERREVYLSKSEKLSIAFLGWFLRLVSAAGIVHGMFKK